jgi:hypothetical protein
MMAEIMHWDVRETAAARLVVLASAAAADGKDAERNLIERLLLERLRPERLRP